MRKTANAAALAVAVGLCLLMMVAAASARPAQVDMDRAIPPMLEFNHWATGQRTPKDPPVIKYASRAALQAMYGCAEAGGCGVMAVTLPDGTIVLDEDFELGRDDYVLVHELVHFMQYSNGVYHDLGRAEQRIKPDTCIAGMEPEAYRAQAAYVAARGAGWAPNDFTVLTYALSCWGN